MRQPLLLFAVGGMLFSHPLHGQTHNVLSAEEKAEGFELLFDGTLNGFKAHWVDYVQGNPNNNNLSSEWQVIAGDQAIGIQANTEDIRSRRKFMDFDLRMDYRCDGNEGVFYRSLLSDDHAWVTGIEYAINNYTNDSKDAPGAAYDLFGPRPNSYQLFSTLKWNSLRVVAKADSIEHWMNGVKVVGFRLHSPAFWKAYEASKWNTAQKMTFKVPGDRSAGFIEAGYLGFQADHNGRWRIRNLRIKEFPPPDRVGQILAPPRRASRNPAFAGLTVFSTASHRWADASGRRIRLPAAPDRGL